MCRYTAVPHKVSGESIKQVYVEMVWQKKIAYCNFPYYSKCKDDLQLITKHVLADQVCSE